MPDTVQTPNSHRSDQPRRSVKKTHRSRRIPLDWAVGHGPVTGALSATTGAAAVALSGAAGGMPSGWPMLIGTAGAVGHGVGHSLFKKLTARTIATRAASWLLAGGWTSWAIAHGPLTWTAIGTLATIGVGIGAAASNAAVHEEAAEEERLRVAARAATAELDSRRREIAAEWEDRILRVTSVRVAVFAVEMWEAGTGFSLAAELPGGTDTWDRVAARAKGLAADARLPRGCTVQVEEGAVQGQVVLDIATVNAFEADHPYPADFAPLSIMTGIPWGLFATGEPAVVFLREACALVVGPPGSGKSTFCDVVLGGFARCSDVLTWVIDLNAGSIGRPWVRAHLEAEGRLAPKSGDTRPPAGTRPGVDWLAGDEDEALLMVETYLAINAARKAGYQDLMHREDVTMLPVSHQLPQIELVIDEGAELLSFTFSRSATLKNLQKGVNTAMRTTRAMGMRLVLTATDGSTSAIGNTEVKKYSPVGVVLTSGESSGNNTAKLVPGARVDAGQLTAKGTGVIGSATPEGFPPTPMKGWKTAPSMARAASLATSDRRPALDAVSARAGGAAYAQRWTPARAGWLWADGGLRPKPPAAGPAAPESPGPVRSGGQEQGLRLSFRRDRPADGGSEDPETLAGELMNEIDQTFGTTSEPPRPAAGPSLDLSFRRRAADAAGGGEPSTTSKRPEWLPRALAAIKDAGPAGMKGSAIADLVDRNRLTVRQTLQAAVDRGELGYRDNGPHSVYIHPDHT